MHFHGCIHDRTAYIIETHCANNGSSRASAIILFYRRGRRERRGAATAKAL
jgi:hypothetical protein